MGRTVGGKVRRPRGKSALALFAQTLRRARGLTQAELADMAQVSIPTIKNIENDRPAAFPTLARVYRDGIVKQRISDEDWFQMMVYWSMQQSGTGGRSLEKEQIGKMLAAKTAENQGHADQIAAIAATLTRGDQELLHAVAQIITQPPVTAALRAIVALAGSEHCAKDSKKDG